MTDARSEVLARIRAAIGGAPDLPYESIAREYGRASDAGSISNTALFADRLQDYGAAVYECTPDEVAQAVGVALTAAGKCSMLIADGFPKALLPDGFRFDVDDSLTLKALDAAEGVLTTCAVAVAETGTIILRHSPADGRRAVTLLPDYHLCIVHESQIVASVPEGIQATLAFATSPITTISGPSATSDIEMTRVKGVHGPRTMDVIIVRDLVGT